VSSSIERPGRFGGYGGYGRRNRSARVRRGPFIIAGATAIVLTGLAGCGNATSSANASSGRAPAADAPQRNSLGEAQRWCGDEEWLVASAGLYVSAYGRTRHPIEPGRIDADLTSGGALWRGYRRLSGGKSTSANLTVRELREFLVTIADADAAGTDPVRYARHIVATCDS
jgi:uncharacterized protein YceK